MDKTLGKILNERDKSRLQFALACEWIRKKQQGRCMENYLKAIDVSSIAIYGMSELGTLLYKELKDASISINYCVENNVPLTGVSIPVLTSRDELPDVEAIIVTPIFDFYEIKNLLREKTTSRVISLEQLIFEM